jgi:hypothetical protein
MAKQLPFDKIKLPPSSSLLVDRMQARLILNCCYMSIALMEQDGKLTPVRLRDGVTSKVFYTKEEVYAKAGKKMPAIIDA